MIKQYKDFWSGIIFIVFGLAVIWVARDYPFGTSIRMGAGYFPTVLGALLAVIGVIVTSRACLKGKGEKPEAFAWKPLLLVLLATAMYGLLVRQAGFVALSFACVLISARASRKGSWKSQLLLGAGTTVCCALIFIYGLGLPLPLWGSFFGQ